MKDAVSAKATSMGEGEVVSCGKCHRHQFAVRIHSPSVWQRGPALPYWFLECIQRGKYEHDVCGRLPIGIGAFTRGHVESDRYVGFDGIGPWNVSIVQDMTNMFSHAGRFNSDRSKWDTSMVTKMSFMFNTASKFDQDISSWRVFNVVLCSTVRWGSQQSLWIGHQMFGRNVDVTEVFTFTSCPNQTTPNLLRDPLIFREKWS